MIQFPIHSSIIKDRFSDPRVRNPVGAWIYVEFPLKYFDLEAEPKLLDTKNNPYIRAY